MFEMPMKNRHQTSDAEYKRIWQFSSKAVSTVKQLRQPLYLEMFIQLMLVNIMKNQGTRMFPDKFDNPVPQNMASRSNL